MRKKLFVLLFAAFGLCGCASTLESVPGNSNEKLVDFELVYDNGMSEIFVDKNTGVMYVMSRYGGISLIYNADGTLKLYEEE